MKDHFYSLFQGLPKETVPVFLRERIEAEIARLERGVRLVRGFSFASVSIVFLVTFIPAVNYLIAQFAGSNFFSYTALLTSDGDFTLLGSKEFLLSLVESLPVSAITLLFGIIFLLLGGIRLIGTKTKQAAELLVTGHFA